MSKGNYKGCVWSGLGTLLLACCVFFALESVATAGSQYQFRSTGDFANVTFSTLDDQYNEVLGYVRVWNQGTQEDPSRKTYLQYFVYSYATGTVSQGYGEIPNTDFKGNYKTGLQLTTDTGHMTGGYQQGLTGPIIINWAKSWGEWDTAGTSTCKDGEIVTLISGNSKKGYATTTGTFLSYTFNTSFMGPAEMGTTNQMNILIQKGP